MTDYDENECLNTPRFCYHLFADDVALVIKGVIENRLSKNVDKLKKQAATLKKRDITKLKRVS
jgi:hypothetical protein